MNRLTYKENGRWCIELHEGIVHTGPKVEQIARAENIAENAETLCDSLELTGRAFNIACECMVHADICLYNDKDKCRKKNKTSLDCTICIGEWIVQRAKKELAAAAQEENT